jgi:hypothetical protein
MPAPTRLLEVNAILLVQAAAAAATPLGAAITAGAGPGWFVTLPDQQVAGDPKNLYDNLLLARFGFN